MNEGLPVWRPFFIAKTNKKPKLAGMSNLIKKQARTAVVVGAGIVGLTSALRLAEAGYAVTVLEQNDAVCVGSSKANAGQLLYDRIGAMGSPGFLRGVPGAVFDADQGMSLAGLANPARWPWALAFLRQCTTHRWRENTRRLLEIAARSKQEMSAFQARYDLAFDWRKSGKLVVHPTEERLQAADQALQFQAQFGGAHEVLDHAACLKHEPALRGATRPIAGGIYLPDASVGDCRKLGGEIAQVLCERLGGQIKYGVQVSGLAKRAGRVTAVQTNQGEITADLFVIANGKSAGALLRGNFAGKKRITPVKGISLTYPVGEAAPDLSVTEAAGRFVVMRLGDRVRVTGYAIFADGEQAKPTYIAALTAKAQSLMPKAARYDLAPEVWVGIRPQTPDDLPMIGLAGAQNLFVNAGHGSLGWTLALGSAEVLMDAINAACAYDP